MESKLNILFVMEQWCDCNPDCGPSGTHHFYLETWKACGLGDCREINYDNRPAAETIIRIMQACKERKPDLVLFTECWGRESATALAPLWPVLQKDGIPVVAVWHDTARQGIWRDLDGIAVNVAVDLPEVRVPMRNAIALWVPQNPNLYFDSTVPRDIPVMHAGSKAPNMKPGMLDWVRSLRCEVTCIGGPREDRLCWSEYATLYRRAKISLNFCKLPDGTPQVKCRVWETIHSNALLLEEDNPETARWLKPEVEYIPFTGQRDCEDKIRYYLRHEEERKQIAQSGYLRAQREYNSRLWWMTVLNAAGLIKPPREEPALTGQYD